MNLLYKKRYDKLIQYRLNNPLFKTPDGDYVEEHHIKPRSFFPKGTSSKIINNKDNLVNLTAREHFIAHCFLAKMYDVGSSKWHKMNKAMNHIICKSNKHKERYVNSRLYEHLKTTYYKQVNKENEEKCLKELNKICDWMDEHNKKPNTRSKNISEKNWSYKISTLKKAKKGNGSTKFYKSYDTLITQRGYSELFDTLDVESLCLKEINKICDWMDKHNGITPNKRSTNNMESKYGKKVCNIKQAKQNKGKGKFYNSYQDLIEERGYPNLFETLDLEEECLKEINELCDWLDKNNGVIPKQQSEDNIEKKVANKIHILRQAKQGNKNWMFRQSYQTLVKQRGYPDLFNIKNLEEECLKELNDLCNWIDDNKKTPNRTSKNPIEKKIARKIDTLRYAKNGKGSTKFFNSYQDLVEQRGYPNLFENIKNIKGT